MGVGPRPRGRALGIGFDGSVASRTDGWGVGQLGHDAMEVVMGLVILHKPLGEEVPHVVAIH